MIGLSSSSESHTCTLYSSELSHIDTPRLLRNGIMVFVKCDTLLKQIVNETVNLRGYHHDKRYLQSN